jgi:hypothetical protein
MRGKPGEVSGGPGPASHRRQTSGLTRGSPPTFVILKGGVVEPQVKPGVWRPGIWAQFA